ncbi:MAG: bifunctional 23S rRNA (guanine(2069)-N(7))-methyltransferase RlmK/23S rRNA (guanine(2445)-N(2))-methyltransferase RlmL [Desulfobulbus propionicus]|nr:MAG: bifunctional 23S rRNA (guanine(2069)-N(7))-methyltransferase RlmK/23S rRNA (guanine(2445)-N(2))-methyltransferase RlmL [Desulfobulbus propionicus]
MPTTPLRRKKRLPLSFVATCSAGLEHLVAEEVTGYKGTILDTTLGAVTWQGSLESAYRACLFSRFASRVLLDLARFQAPDPDAIYAFGLDMDWEAVFDVHRSLAIFCTLSGKSPITHSRFAALRLKDAIADAFRKRTGRRPSVDLHRPDIRLNLHIQGTTATLALDLSGESLHRRGYREGTGIAPLKESLAAALVHLSGWLDIAGEGATLLDPMCGSGTLLIEAAMMFADSAPGLNRDHFGFLAWNRHDSRLWERLLDEARQREAEGLQRDFPEIRGYDADPEVIGIARRNIQAAGFADVITVEQGQLATTQCPEKPGVLLTNPPYGERLSQRQAVKYLYQYLGRKFSNDFSAWKLALFTANPEFMQLPKIQWQKRHTLYNGPLKCQFLAGNAHQKPDAAAQRKVLRSGIEHPLARRLEKNCARLFPLAEREGVECFRVYDSDIPEFNLAIDCYGPWIHVLEYAAAKSVDQRLAEERFREALTVLRDLFQVRKQQIFIKHRNTRQHHRKAQGKLREVKEKDCRLLVNLSDHQGTGLHLERRTVRERIKKRAAQGHFLYLFAHTGAATAHAALGGALSTTSVDSSEAHLSIANANLAVNGFGGPLHRLIKADPLKFLRMKVTKRLYDLILVAPPSLLKGRKNQPDFDVQRDHREILELAMSRLTPKGTLVFTTSLRSFTLDAELNNLFQLEDISHQTLPFDFQKGSRTRNHCFELHHKAKRLPADPQA